jgi:hypothetical protein
MTITINGDVSEKDYSQYVVYKRLRNEWKELGNKKMVRFFNKRMGEIRLTKFGIC